MIVTAQQAVNFIFDARRHGKNKNSKIEWNVYDMYRPGKNNIPADTLSHVQCNALTNIGKLQEIHKNLCHPGITMLVHFVKVRNLPYSIEDVKRMCTVYAVCVLDRNDASIHQKQDTWSKQLNRWNNSALTLRDPFLQL